MSRRVEQMNKEVFIQLMKFPEEWLEWDMYPDELFAVQGAGYVPGHEAASEHDRHGAFQWWLKSGPSEEQLFKLAKLTYLDPEKNMGAYVRGFILRAGNCDDRTKQLIGDDWINDE